MEKKVWEELSVYVCLPLKSWFVMRRFIWPVVEIGVCLWRDIIVANNSRRPSFVLLHVAAGSTRLALTPVCMEFKVMQLILGFYSTCL